MSNGWFLPSGPPLPILTDAIFFRVRIAAPWKGPFQVARAGPVATESRPHEGGLLSGDLAGQSSQPRQRTRRSGGGATA